MKVIDPKNKPTHLPLTGIAVTWLLLDYYSAPGWVRGIVWTLVGIVVIACCYNFYKEEHVDIFKDKK